MREIDRRKENYGYFFDPEADPILTVEPGETVLIRTEDALSGQVVTEDDAKLLEKTETETLWNPITGPIYVEGAEPGDNLVVQIEDIKVGGPRKQGVVPVLPPWVTLDGSSYTLNSPLKTRVTLCCFKDGKVFFPVEGGEEIIIPIQPLIGTLGVAPKLGKIRSTWHSQEVCGNTDSRDVTVGSKVILPVNVNGALFSVGDVAAASGDGEIASHIDTQGDLKLTFDLIKRKESRFVAWPQVESPDYIGSIGCPLGGSLTDAVRAASKDMVLRLERFYGFDRMDAYQLLSLVVEIRVNQVVNGLGDGCCVAKIQRKYLK